GPVAAGRKVPPPGQPGRGEFNIERPGLIVRELLGVDFPRRVKGDGERAARPLAAVVLFPGMTPAGGTDVTVVVGVPRQARSRRVIRFDQVQAPDDLAAADAPEELAARQLLVHTPSPSNPPASGCFPPEPIAWRRLPERNGRQAWECPWVDC